MNNENNGVNGTTTALANRVNENIFDLSILEKEGIFIPEKCSNVPGEMKKQFKAKYERDYGEAPKAKQVTEWFQGVQRKLRPMNHAIIAECTRAGWDLVWQGGTEMKDGHRVRTFKLIEPKPEKLGKGKESGFFKLLRVLYTTMRTFDHKGLPCIPREFYQACKAAAIPQEKIAEYTERLIKEDEAARNAAAKETESESLDDVKDLMERNGTEFNAENLEAVETFLEGELA